MSFGNILKGFKSSRGGKSILTLDIGTSSLKLAEIERRGKGYAVKNLVVEKLPPELIVGKEIMDRQEIISRIQSLWTKLGTETRSVMVNVAGQDVIVKVLTVAKQKKREELDQSVLWKMREEISTLDPTEVAWGYYVIGDSHIPDSYDILLATAKLDVVYGLVDIIRAAGLEPFGINVDADAIYRNLKYNDYAKEGETIAVVHIGYENTIVELVQNGRIMFSREINLASKTYIESISRFLDLSKEISEEVLYKGAGDKVEEEAYRDTMESLNDRFVGNLERNLQGVLPEGQEVSRWLLSGGGAYIKGLPDFMKEKFKGEVEILDPFKNFEYEAEVGVGDIPSIYTIALGLGVSYFDKEHRINLLPQEELRVVEEISLVPHVILTGSILIILIIIMGVISVFQSRKISKSQAELNQLKQEEVVLQRKANEIKGIKKQIEEVRGKIEVLQSLSMGRTRYVQILNEVNKRLTPDTWLRGLREINNSTIEIDGDVGSNLRLASFMESLRKSIYVRDMQLVESKVEKQGDRKVASFKLKVYLKGTGEEPAQSMKQGGKS